MKISFLQQFDLTGQKEFLYFAVSRNQDAVRFKGPFVHFNGLVGFQGDKLIQIRLVDRIQGFKVVVGEMARYRRLQV